MWQTVLAAVCHLAISTVVYYIADEVVLETRYFPFAIVTETQSLSVRNVSRLLRHFAIRI